MRFGGLIVAIVLAAIAAVIVLRTSSHNANAPVPTVGGSDTSKSVNIYVATKEIPVGTKITADMISVQPWPEHLMLDGFVRAEDSNNTVVGSVARGTFQAQEPIISSKLANANDPNFIAGELPKGMRVLTIATNEIEGVAGFVFPGDHVDIMLTRMIDKSVSNTDLQTGRTRIDTKQTPITETLLNNVRVIAVDQRSTAAGAVDKDGKLVIPRSVSLMVTPSDAQRLRLGAKAGTLTMALRGVADHDATDPLIITGISDISQAKEGEGGSDGVLVLRGAPGDNREVSNDAFRSMVPVAVPMTPVIPGHAQ